MGTERTDVAVGTLSEASMFLAVRIGAPRSTVRRGATAEGSGRSDGFGALADRPAPVPGVEGDSLVGLTYSTIGWFPSCRGVRSCGGGVGRSSRAGGVGVGAVFVGMGLSLKKACHDSSTDEGSFSQASRISSINQEFAPNASCESGVDIFASGRCHNPLT